MVALGDKLAAARRRARQRQWVHAVAAAGVAAAALALVLALIDALPVRWLGPLAALRDNPQSLWAIVVAAFVAFAITYAIGARRVPDEVALARAADEAYGFKQTVSTVTELDARGPRADSAVLTALYRTAEADAARIEPEKLVPIRLPRPALALPILLLATAATLAVTPQARLAETAAIAAEAPPPMLDETERERVSADIARVTETINQQIESVPDAYMEAVSRTLETLGQRIATDPGLTREEVAETLAALAAHTEQATGSFPRSSRERIAEVLDAMAGQVEAPPQPVASGEDSGTPAEGEAGAPQDGASGASSGESGESPDLESMLESMENAQQNLGEGIDLDNLDNAAAPNSYSGYLEAAAERNRQALERAEEMAAQAQLMGGATESQAGESDLAGEGTDTLDQGGDGIAAVEFESSEDLMLAADPSGEGRRFEMDLPPESEFSAPDLAFALPDGSQWTYTPESVADRNAVALVNRDAVSIYLRALTESAPGGEAESP